MSAKKAKVKRGRDDQSGQSGGQQRSGTRGRQQPDQRPLDTGGLIDPGSSTSDPIGPDMEDNTLDNGGDIERPPIEHGTKRSRNDR